MRIARFSLAGILLLLVLAAMPVLGAEAEKPTVAVMDFAAANTSSGEAAVVSEFVRQAVVRSGKFLVVEKKNQDKILSEQAFQQTGCTSSDCAVKLGKLLNARKMIVGEFAAIGGVRFLTASLVDVESGAIEQTGRVRGFDPATADMAADELVSDLTGVRVSVTGGQVRKPRRPRAVRPRFAVAAGVRDYSFTYKLDFTNASPPSLVGAHTGAYAGASREATSRQIAPGVGVDYWRTFRADGSLGFGVTAGVFFPAQPSPPISVVGTPATGRAVIFTTASGSSSPGLEGGVDLFWNARDWLNVLAGLTGAMYSFTADGGYFDDSSGMPLHKGVLTMTGSAGTAVFFGGNLGVEAFPFEHFSARFTVAFGPKVEVKPMLLYEAEFTVNSSPILEAKLLYSF